MAFPRAEIIPRHPSARAADPDLPAADWSALTELLRGGTGLTWLSVPSPAGVHVRPVFAAWTGTSLVFASNGRAAKSRHLDAAGRCTLAVAFDLAHLVVDGTVARLTGADDLARASAALQDVYRWPTTVVGDELDAPYGAPTAGGPPFRAYEVRPERAFAFPTNDQFEPTRFTFA